MAIAELVMPKLGESIMEATILKWHKKPGDTVSMDETILDIATDKVDSEVPSTAAGELIEILFNENDVVPIGTVIARINTQAFGEVVSTSYSSTLPSFEEQVPRNTEEIVEEIPYTPSSTIVPNIATSVSSNRFYSPLVLNIANNENIGLAELETIPGTGNEGRLTKKDILQYISNKNSGNISGISSSTDVKGTNIPVEPIKKFAPPIQSIEEPVLSGVPPVTKQVVINTKDNFNDASSAITTGETEIIEMDRMRKLIAKHMVDSKHISPHVTSFSEADVTNMVMWREKVKHDFEHREGTKITYTPMFMECIARVIRNFPMINSSLVGDQIIIKKDINIGLATALPSGNLIVPVIKGADKLTLVGLCNTVNGLADSARNGKLKPDDTIGGTFTLTNVGTFGSLMGTPIINQPQVAILAIGAIKKRAVVIESPEGDSIGIRHMMYLSLSYDHRIIDGSIGASFLTAVCKELESWDPNKKWFHYI
jgi:2-oxoglutarate dehydrogenase E2 component (dihydrolipoamide succinyltransferase)